MRPPSAIAESRIAGRQQPLSETLGDPRLEAAAAILVITLAERGDEWRVVTALQALGSVARAAAKPEYACLNNLSVHPNFSGLVDEGFARWRDLGASDGKNWTRRRPIEFTETGLIAIGATLYTTETTDYE